MPKKTTRKRQGAKVLLVDDEPFLREAITECLEARGYVVREACDGRDAIKALDDFVPDIIVTDMQMPIMTGPEFIEWKATSKFADVPLIGITATPHLVPPGCDVLVKVFTNQALVDRIEAHLSEDA